jgi:methylmalonyl-CoA mutase cobalamin-binding subunit
VPLLETMRAAAKDAGRDPDAIEVTAGGAMDLDGVRRFADLGVDRVVLPPLGWDLDTLREQLGRFAENVIQKTS